MLNVISLSKKKRYVIYSYSGTFVLISFIIIDFLCLYTLSCNNLSNSFVVSSSNDCSLLAIRPNISLTKDSLLLLFSTCNFSSISLCSVLKSENSFFNVS